MKAADLMITNVISVGPDTSVQEVARILLEERISAVPVVGRNGQLLGIVSEGDLMRRAEAGTGRTRSWWSAFFTRREVRATKREALATEFVKEHSRKVTDVMTRDVVTAAPDASLSTIANLLETNAIKRVPIVQQGKVVGIVSRANLLQALASLDKEADVTTQVDDAKIRRGVLAQLKVEPWTRPALINVIVQDGTVDLWGVVASTSEKTAVRVAAEVVPGVRVVNDHLVVRPARSDEQYVRRGAANNRAGLIIGLVAGMLILIFFAVLVSMR